MPTERFQTREFVRWSDVDKAGIICYGSYVRFFEIAETELFRSIGYPYSKLFETFDIWLPRRQLHFEFESPALLDDLLEIEAWVGRVGTTSLRLEFETFKLDGSDRVRTAHGYVVMVATSQHPMRPVPVPSEIVERLAPFRADLPS